MNAVIDLDSMNKCVVKGHFGRRVADAVAYFYLLVFFSLNFNHFIRLNLSPVIITIICYCHYILAGADSKA